MSLFEFKLRLFLNPKVLLPVILFGLLGFLIVDDTVQNIANNIQFSEPLRGLEGMFQALILERGARAVWLWTLLPAQIAWLFVSCAIKKFEKFA